VHTENRIHYIAAGRALGGGSTLNYGDWARGDASDYDDWARVVGDSRWSYKSLLPFFKKSEYPFDSVANPEQRGLDGPVQFASITASDPQRWYPLREIIYAAWAELGVKHNPDTNSGCLSGISEIEENWKNGLRQPSYKTYGFGGVQVLTNTMVHRVLIKTSSDGQDVASGVQLVDGRQIAARKEVIVCAGIYRTPQLLKLSGIGPASELAEHGIPLIKDNPQVGQNLFEHFALFLFWKLREPLALGGSPIWSSPAFAKKMPNVAYVPRPHRHRLHLAHLTAPHRPKLLRHKRRPCSSDPRRPSCLQGHARHRGSKNHRRLRGPSSWHAGPRAG
jgi:choline dehydrogenase-like flavoprotein